MGGFTMDRIELVSESIIKLEEIKQEPEEPVWNTQELVDDLPMKREVKEEEDKDENEERKLKPPVAIFLEDVVKQEVDWEERPEEERLALHAEDRGEGEEGRTGTRGGVHATTDSPSEKPVASAIGRSLRARTKSPSAEGESPSPALANAVGQTPEKRSAKASRTFECPLCRKRFKDGAYLAAHKRTHTGERPHRCSVCRKDFTFRQSLYRHMVSHSDERPHNCSVCQKSFKSSGDLVKHVQRHSAETPSHCSICDESFPTKALFAKHMRTHPHRCSVCQVGFKCRPSLLKHEELHRQGLHTCPVCKKICRDFANHMGLHSRETPMGCPVCHEVFKVKDLLPHMGTH